MFVERFLAFIFLVKIIIYEINLRLVLSNIFHFSGRLLQALKALILERMGKADEALSVCLSAKELLYTNDSVLMDDLTLSTLQIVFQRLDHCQYNSFCLSIY